MVRFTILTVVAFASLAAIGCSGGGSEGPISVDNFKKIQIGMSQQDVDNILGEGTAEDPAGTPGLPGETHRAYGKAEANQSIVVGFTDGKVVGKVAVLTDSSGNIRLHK